MSLFDPSIFDQVPSKCCSICGERKPFEGFHRVSRSSDGRSTRCRECRSKMASEWREKHRETILPKERRNRLRDRYNLTLEQYDQMVAAQSNLCALCGEPPSGKRANHGVLNVDHSHKHGYVRSLLCDLCNKMLGQSRDDPALLRKAADYLEEHAARNKSRQG